MPFVVAGLTAGSVYGLAGTGLVVTYKTTGILNFAHGAFATIGAYVFFWLYADQGLSWPWAFVVSVLVVGPVLGILFELLTRRLAATAPVITIISTVGIALMVVGLATLWYGREGDLFPAYLPTNTIKVFDVYVGWDQIIVMIVALASTAGLYSFFRFSRSGAAMRAVVDNPDLLDLSGTSPIVARRRACVIGATFAVMSGVLIAPSLNLDAFVLTLLVVQSFGAAAIGYFSNLPLAYVGGLAIGIGASFATKYSIDVSWLQGVGPSLPFIVLFLVLILLPRAKLTDRRILRPRPRPVWRAPARVQLPLGGALLVALVLVPQLVGTRLVTYTSALTYVILFLSLGLLVRTSGQVSLCHIGFAAIGATSFSHLTDGTGVPWLLGLLGAGLVVVPIGALIAIPAIRLSGVYLALATLGFGVFLERLMYTSSVMFGSGLPGEIPMPRPHLEWLGVSGDEGFYYVVLTCTLVVAVVTIAIQHSRLGRLLRALGQSPTALATHGATVNVTKVLVFCISAFFAGIAGALYGMIFERLNSGSVAFSSFQSLIILTLLVIAIGGEPWYAFFAGAVFTLVPSYIKGDDTSIYLQILFGVGAIAVALTASLARDPNRRLHELIDRIAGRRPQETAPVPRVMAAPAAVPRPVASVDARPGLEINGLTVRYGGVLAVDGLNLAAPSGRITGLIGPNGAGKTTTFNACCGLLRPDTGRVTLHSRDITRLGSAARARHGLGRTFQRTELFDALTVRENVAMGREASLAGVHPLRQLAAKPGDAETVAESAHGALALCAIEHLAHLQAGTLSTGQRRLVELARCLAGPFDMLLLDEPSAGLDRTESERFGALLQRVVAERGLGILLVEHDMSLVMEICQHIYVLDFGERIFDGTPAEVSTSAAVRAAYLGSDEAGLVSQPAPA